MNEHHYDLRFLPTFEEDLNEAVDYIRLQLCNPIAARNLVTEVEKAIYEMLRFPEAFAPYESVQQHKYPYYCIPVKNYMVFYVVIGNTMEVRRLIFNRRAIRNII